MSLKRKSRNAILMTRNYLDLGSASDWLKFIFQPIRSTTQDQGSYASSVCNFFCSFLDRHISRKPEMAS